MTDEPLGIRLEVDDAIPVGKIHIRYADDPVKPSSLPIDEFRERMSRKLGAVGQRPLTVADVDYFAEAVTTPDMFGTVFTQRAADQIRQELMERYAMADEHGESTMFEVRETGRDDLFVLTFHRKDGIEIPLTVGRSDLQSLRAQLEMLLAEPPTEDDGTRPELPPFYRGLTVLQLDEALRRTELALKHQHRVRSQRYSAMRTFDPAIGTLEAINRAQLEMIDLMRSALLAVLEEQDREDV